MKPSPSAHYDYARSDWICDVCDNVTDFCDCDDVPCPDADKPTHNDNCPMCKGEGVCFPETRAEHNQTNPGY